MKNFMEGWINDWDNTPISDKYAKRFVNEDRVNGSITEAEQNNNWKSNSAKEALIAKYLKDHGQEPTKEAVKEMKSRCILHHLNGDHNNDKDLANDVLIVTNSADDARRAHKLLHLLSYCYIEDDLKSKFDTLHPDLYFHPDYSRRAQPISMETIANGLVQHNKSLRDISLIDHDEDELDHLGHNNFAFNTEKAVLDNIKEFAPKGTWKVRIDPDGDNDEWRLFNSERDARQEYNNLVDDAEYDIQLYYKNKLIDEFNTKTDE